MKDIPILIQCLENSPIIFKNLIDAIPPELLKQKRIKGKWSIHEHACHLAQAEKMIYERFEVFEKEERPVFLPYIPGKTIPVGHLLQLDLNIELNSFFNLRKRMVELLNGFSEDIWHKKANHHEYNEYSSYILLRHTLMHDHFHMYRIEELWLTKEEYLSGVKESYSNILLPAPSKGGEAAC